MLIWQWGRRGAGPRYAAGVAAALNRLPDHRASLSLSTRAELLGAADAPAVDLPVSTYAGPLGYAARLATLPLGAGALARRLRPAPPAIAVCAMPGPLDLMMVAALTRLGVPYAVTVHDARAHPGDGLPMQMILQARLVRGAAVLVALSGHVASALAGTGRPVIRSVLPPLAYRAAATVRRDDGIVQLVSFGRLLPYKGLDLLAEAAARLPPGFRLRVVGQGPETPALAALRRLPAVTVENRWVPEDEVGPLLASADIAVLSHTEASQSGVAASALAAGLRVAATRVGGTAEQLGGQPGAVLADPNPAALADAILRAASLPPPPRPDVTAAWDRTAVALAEALAPFARH